MISNNVDMRTKQSKARRLLYYKMQHSMMCGILRLSHSYLCILSSEQVNHSLILVYNHLKMVFIVGGPPMIKEGEG